MTGEPTIAELLPHGGRARLVTAVQDRQGSHEIECCGRIPSNSPFAWEGRAPAFMALELAAQAAALLGFLARLEGGGHHASKVGYLVGVSEGRFTRQHVPTEETLIVRLRVLGEAASVSKYAATVWGPEGEVCRATLSTHRGGGA